MDGVEDEAALGGVIVGRWRADRGGAKIEERAIVGPSNGGIVNGVAGLGELGDELEFEWATRDAVAKFFEQIVGGALGVVFGSGGGVLADGVDLVAGVANFAGRVGEL